MGEEPETIPAAELFHNAPCAIISTDKTGRILRSNRTLAHWLDCDHADLAGKNFCDVLAPSSHLYYEAQIVPRLQLQGFAREISCKIKVGSEHQTKSVLMNANLRGSMDGSPDQIDIVLFDVTERAIFEAQLRDSRSEAEELAAIVRSATVGILRTDHRGRPVRLNATAAAALGVNIDSLPNRSISELLVLDAPRQDWFEHAKESIGGTGIEHRFEANAEGGAVFDISIAPIVNPEEPFKPLDYSVILRDVTERVSAQRRLTLMINEMNHRIRNTFSVVIGLVRQSMPRPELKAERDKLVDRLRSLSASHDLLTTNCWEALDITELLKPLTAQIGDDARISLEGPSVRLTPDQFKALSMAFHELCTNARKYGALSRASGRIEVRWSLDGPERRQLNISWREMGGPLVKEPKNRGFGTVMIERMLAAEFNGEAKIHYRPTGLEFRCRGVLRAT